MNFLSSRHELEFGFEINDDLAMRRTWSNDEGDVEGHAQRRQGSRRQNLAIKFGASILNPHRQKRSQIAKGSGTYVRSVVLASLSFYTVGSTRYVRFR